MSSNSEEDSEGSDWLENLKASLEGVELTDARSRDGRIRREGEDKEDLSDNRHGSGKMMQPFPLVTTNENASSEPTSTTPIKNESHPRPGSMRPPHRSKGKGKDKDQAPRQPTSSTPIKQEKTNKDDKHVSWVDNKETPTPATTTSRSVHYYFKTAHDAIIALAQLALEVKLGSQHPGFAVISNPANPDTAEIVRSREIAAENNLRDIFEGVELVVVGLVKNG